jgi:hypothetical protein
MESSSMLFYLSFFEPSFGISYSSPNPSTGHNKPAGTISLGFFFLSLTVQSPHLIIGALLAPS